MPPRGHGRFLHGQPLRPAHALPQGNDDRPDPVGPGNDAALLAAAAKCEKVVAAWGVTGDYQDRTAAVVSLLSGYDLWCLGTTKAGHPRHPLYVKADQPLVRWTP